MTQSPHIIIVDDEAPAREMVGDYLKMHGFGVTLCDGGKSLRSVIETNVPDLVVLDLNMPEEDGLSIIRDLKSRINVPVIMLTATASPIDRVVGLESVRGAVAGGLLASLTWEAALLGVLLVFVVRPAAGWVGLLGERRLSPLDRGIASFFGIRGIGCLYYLAYGLQKENFANENLLWATCAFTITLSVVVHGVMASPVIKFRDRHTHGEAKGDGGL